MPFDAAAAWDDPSLRSRFFSAEDAAARGGSAMSYLSGSGGPGAGLIRPLGDSAKAFRGSGAEERQAITDSAMGQAADAFRTDAGRVLDRSQQMMALGDQAVKAVQKARHAKELARASTPSGGGIGDILGGISSIAGLGKSAGWWGRKSVHGNNA